MDKKLRLSLIFQAAGNATNFMRGMKGESDRTAKALGAARQRVQELQRTTRDVAAFRAMETRLDGTRGALQAAQGEARRLALAHAAAERPTKQLTRAFEVARRKVRELKTQEEGQVRTLQDLRGRLETAGVSTRNLGAHEMRLARQTRDANAALSDQVRRMEQVNQRQRQMGDARGRYDRTQALASTAMSSGTSAVGAGVAAAAPLFISARAGMSFEDGMADVRKVVGFDTPRQFAQMGDDILTLSTRIPIGAEGLTQIVAAAGQAGIARGELLGFTEDAGKMAIAFDTTAEDAGQKMATWRTAFRMTQAEVLGLSDQINYLGNTGKANALQISNIVTRVGPLGEVAGLAAGEVAALGSTIASMGVEEEIAATGIKNTMLALTKGTAATKAQRTAFKALGLDAEKVSKSMQMDAGGTIVDVMERISKLKPDQQSAILTQLFGSESVAAIAPLLTNLGLLKGNLDKVAKSSLYAGSMQKEFEARASTTSNAVQLAKQGLQAVAIEIGSSFLPQIKAGSVWLGKVAQGVRGFANAHPGAIKLAGGLLAIVAGGLVIFGGLAMAVAAVLGPFALMQLALTQSAILFGPMIAGLGTAAGAAWTAAAGFMAAAWPILAVVAAVALLAGGVYLLIRNWSTVGPILAGIWQRMREVAGSVLSGIGRAFLNFTPAGLLVQAIMRAWPALQALGGRFMELGRHLLTGLVNGVLGGIPALVRAVMSAGGRIISGFKQKLGIHSPSRVFAQLGDYTMQGLGVGLSRSTQGALGHMRNAATALTSAGAVALSGAATAPEFDTGPRISQRPPAVAAAGQGRSATPSIGSLTIQIYQQPGESMDELARKVADLIKQPDLAAFADDRDSYGEA